MRETILLGENDSLAEARAKLGGVQARRVALVIPPRCTLLRSEVDLALLAREALPMGYAPHPGPKRRSTCAPETRVPS